MRHLQRRRTKSAKSSWTSLMAAFFSSWDTSSSRLSGIGSKESIGMGPSTSTHGCVYNKIELNLVIWLNTNMHKLWTTASKPRSIRQEARPRMRKHLLATLLRRNSLCSDTQLTVINRCLEKSQERRHRLPTHYFHQTLAMRVACANCKSLKISWYTWSSLCKTWHKNVISNTQRTQKSNDYK